METGYEVEPRQLKGSARGRVWLVVLAVAVFLGVVLVKPWETRPVTTIAPIEAGIASPGPVASPGFAVIRIQPAPSLPPPIWPAASVASKHATATAKEAEGALGELAVHAGAWGVGVAGVGPRMIRDEPWTDWAAATPEPVDGGPLHILMWPGTSLCDGYPTINDRPSLVAVTTAADLVSGWQLVGYWTNGHKVGALKGSVRQVSVVGQIGITYLERTDRAPWPSGRYEFHVISGDRVEALTVCITRPA
jgi:hypothetical protein